ncbi:DUF5719 family protein [Microbacterium nymphoidis]|uniref:DUF5719 family protein n=1 Tax=Microbacterium nymphoidis TaxID=2898586 RepID=UPI001E54A3F4|nr:DUF5719 family protein [Microbacterium nymphoidis]MCD2499755.1 DUF5719 family protein [Microbacterium nymphoidis]
MTKEPSRGRLARAGAGILAVAVTAVGVAAAVVSPLPAVSAAVPATVREPAPGDVTLVCTGSALVLGRVTDSAQTVSEAARLTPILSDSGAASDELPVLGVDGAVFGVVSAPPVDGKRAAVAGAASFSSEADDLSGYAASSCRPPLTESWLVGIDGRTGSSGVITIANPFGVTATVSFTVYGLAGPTTPAGGSLSVAPGTVATVPVASLSSGDSSPVINVHAEGAPVQASLQSALVRGLVPAGIDFQDAVRQASARQIIPGVTVTTAGPALTSVRVLMPDASGPVTVSAQPVDGAAAPVQLSVDAVAGIPVDIPLDALPAGAYDVTVEGASPLVAAVWQATGAGEGDDDAWYPAAPEISAPTAFAVAGGAAAVLALWNDGDDDVSATVTVGGRESTVNVPAHGGAQVPVASTADAVLDPGEGALHATVSYADGQRLAAAAVWPADADSAPITITR